MGIAMLVVAAAAFYWISRSFRAELGEPPPQARRADT